MLEAVPGKTGRTEFRGGVAGNVVYGGTALPPAIERAGPDKPSPKDARASGLPNLVAPPIVLASPEGQCLSSTRIDAVFRRRMTFAALMSAWSRCPQVVQTKLAWFLRLRLSTAPHAKHVREVLWAGTLASVGGAGRA